MGSMKDALIGSMESSMRKCHVDEDVITVAILTATRRGCNCVISESPRNVTVWTPDGVQGWSIKDRQWCSGGEIGTVEITEIDRDGYPVA